jgi:hypothetical protein
VNQTTATTPQAASTHTVPALDLTRTGHLPYAVATAQHPDAAGIILQLEKQHAEMYRAGLGSPALDAFHDELVRQVAEADDPKATFDRIVQLMAEHRAKAVKCRAYPAWCTETGAHDDHIGAAHRIGDGHGDDMISAQITHFAGGRPTVAIGEAVFTAEEARAKAAELRRFADRVEKLAGHVEDATQGRAGATA